MVLNRKFGNHRFPWNSDLIRLLDPYFFLRVACYTDNHPETPDMQVSSLGVSSHSTAVLRGSSWKQVSMGRIFRWESKKQVAGFMLCILKKKHTSTKKKNLKKTKLGVGSQIPTSVTFRNICLLKNPGHGSVSVAVAAITASCCRKLACLFSGQKEHPAKKKLAGSKRL